MKGLLKFLKGKKTYFAAAALFVVGGLEALGWLPKDVTDPLKVFLGAAGLAALRAAK
jgi:hypothetical protein